MTVSPLFSVFVQVWQCGGSVEVLPCSRIAHIERAHKPYTEDLTSHVRRNALRVAEVWMDEFKSHVYMAWNIPMEVSDSGNHVLFCFFYQVQVMTYRSYSRYLIGVTKAIFCVCVFIRNI